MLALVLLSIGHGIILGQVELLVASVASLRERIHLGGVLCIKVLYFCTLALFLFNHEICLLAQVAMTVLSFGIECFDALVVLWILAILGQQGGFLEDARRLVLHRDFRWLPFTGLIEQVDFLVENFFLWGPSKSCLIIYNASVSSAELVICNRTIKVWWGRTDDLYSILFKAVIEAGVRDMIRFLL